MVSAASIIFVLVSVRRLSDLLDVGMGSNRSHTKRLDEYTVYIYS